MEVPGKLVVRTYAPARRWVIAALCLLLAGVALYAAFELGRFKAGYDAMQAASDRSALRTQIDQQQRDQRQMRVQLAAAEEARVADVRERTEVSRTIGELQAQIERQQQDVEFYRGLVQQPQVPNAPKIHVDQIHLSEQQPQHYLLRFSLSRLTRASDVLAGALAISVDGARGGIAESLDHATLTTGKAELPFSFRYTTTIEQPITLPDDFKPDRVTIEVRPAHKGVAPYRQTFVWNIDPG